MNGNFGKLEHAVNSSKPAFPGITFGYLGNVERWGDDRTWFIFLPCPGRIGSYNDQVRLGSTKDIAEHADIDAVISSSMARVELLWPKGRRQ